MGGFFKALWPFGRKDAPPPKRPRTPSPGAGTTSPGTGSGATIHPITREKPMPDMTCPTCDGLGSVPQPEDAESVTCPTCKGTGWVAEERLSFFLNGEKAVFTTTEYGTTTAQEMEADGSEPIKCEIHIDGLTPEEYAALVETEDFRDKLPHPGSGLLRIDAWPYNDPLYYVEDVVLVGTDVETGEPAGYVNVLQNTGAQKHIYFANTAPQGHHLDFAFEINLAGPRSDSKTTYGKVKVFCQAADPFGNGLPFNVDLNIV